MSSLAMINVVTLARQSLPRVRHTLFFLYQKRLTHRDVELILSEKPAKISTLWMEFVKTHRLDILEKNPQLHGNDRSILRMVRERFNALTPDEVEEVEVEYENTIKDYHILLHEWNSRMSPEEKIAVFRYEVESEKRRRDKTRRRLENQAKRKGPNTVNPQETGEPKKPGGVFLAFFVPTLNRPLGQPYQDFLIEAGEKWRNLTEEEANVFWRKYYDSVEEYQTNFDAWIAKQTAENPSFSRKSYRKGQRLSSEEMFASRTVLRKRRGPSFYPDLSFYKDLSFHFDENAPDSILQKEEAFRRQDFKLEKDMEEEVPSPVSCNDLLKENTSVSPASLSYGKSGKPEMVKSGNAEDLTLISPSEKVSPRQTIFTDTRAPTDAEDPQSSVLLQSPVAWPTSSIPVLTRPSVPTTPTSDPTPKPLTPGPSSYGRPPSHTSASLVPKNDSASAQVTKPQNSSSACVTTSSSSTITSSAILLPKPRSQRKPPPFRSITPDSSVGTAPSSTNKPEATPSPPRLPRPPRPKNAFFVFQEMFEKSPRGEHKQLVKLVTAKWKSMTDEERAPFYKRAKIEYEEYAERMRKWGESEDWRLVPRAHRDMSTAVREPFVRPFGFFIKTLTRKEKETLGQVTRRAAELWKGLEEEEKAKFKEIFSFGKDVDISKNEWREYLAGRERNDYM